MKLAWIAAIALAAGAFLLAMHGAFYAAAAPAGIAVVLIGLKSRPRP
jgi:hypothetical protein